VNIKRVLLTFVFLLFSQCAFSKDVLIVSHNHDESSASHKAIVYMAKRLREKTDAQLDIKIYPNSQLGSQRESMELMQIGAIDIVKSNAAELESFHAQYGTFNVPYLFVDNAHYYRALTSDVGKEILRSSAGKGFVGLAYLDAGARSFYSSVAINTPSDIKGMKIRVQPSESAMRMVELMGALPTPIAYGELYTALQQSVVDGAENNIMALTKARHGEVSNIYSLDEHTMIPDVLLLSEATLKKLSVEEKVALFESAREATAYMKKLWQDEVNKAEVIAKNMGVLFNRVDKASFRKAVQPLYDEALQDKNIGAYVLRIKELEIQ